jgi:hypothetical protein
LALSDSRSCCWLAVQVKASLFRKGICRPSDWRLAREYNHPILADYGFDFWSNFLVACVMSNPKRMSQICLNLDVPIH